ncbi:MAG: SDR family NAD(P)-dependent oxidoreductase [Deltaproteobacteria bacterium]|nr:SDR family NAD(P)-dependent oxidoreductase [Deltaproteobacteria bacterium]
MKWNEENVADQAGKLAIVTGANSGIGYETARVLAAKGARVMLACRDQEKGADAIARIRAAHPEASLELGDLDLSSLASVRRFAEDYATKHERLDLLINNAGVMVPPYQKTQDGFELQMGTNHFGHFALTGLLLPSLCASSAPRVVNVASLAHKLGKIRFDDISWEKGYKPWAAYGQSKLANLLFTYELQRWAEAHDLPLTVTAAHPGWTSTNLSRDSWSARVVGPLFAMKPIGGALPTLYAASEDAEPGAYYGPDGVLGWTGAPTKVTSNACSHDQEVAHKLWELSEQLTDVRFSAEAS